MPEPSVNFRDAEMADLPQIIAMLADDALAREREANTAAVLQSHTSAFSAIDGDPNHELIVGTMGDDVIAVLQLSYLPGLTYSGGWRAQIEGVRVARTHHSKGIGKQLIQHAIERARSKQCVLVQLTTDQRRDRALLFYAKLGFEPSHIGMKLRLRHNQAGDQP
jgi:ribosomal protein S18 acetylase RimI-like enzyme